MYLFSSSFASAASAVAKSVGMCYLMNGETTQSIISIREIQKKVFNFLLICTICVCGRYIKVDNDAAYVSAGRVVTVPRRRICKWGRAAVSQFDCCASGREGMKCSSCRHT